MEKIPLLVVVDMQNDFVNGALGSADAKAIVENVARKIKDWRGEVVYTKDTHYNNYMTTLEGTHIPVPHCIVDTEGWRLEPTIEAAKSPRSITFLKETFGCRELCRMVEHSDFGNIEIVGLCTDICVVSNALALRMTRPDLPIAVDSSCCAGTSPVNHRAALMVMKACCIDVVND